MINLKSLFLAAVAAAGISAAAANVEYVRENPEKYWDFSKLSKAPKWKKVSFKESDVKDFESIFFEGVPVNGKPAPVFAYIGYPETPAPAGGYPGVVMIHGGGGTAYSSYARLWTKRGFAVIAIDWYNSRPLLKVQVKKVNGRTRRINKLPLEGGERNLIRENAANMVLAHSLLRSLPNVNPEKTVYVGLSWGSWYGTIVSAVDPRFKGCVEIYCGDRKVLNRKNKSRWLIDGRFLHASKVPMFWVTSTHDQNVTLQSLQKGFDECPTIVNKNFVVNLPHSHVGFTFESCFRMANYFVGNGKMLPKLGEVTVKNGVAECDVVYEGNGITETVFCYTADRGVRQHKRKWKTIPVKMVNKKLSIKLPDDLYVGFFSAYDQKSRYKDCCGSSDIIEK